MKVDPQPCPALTAIDLLHIGSIVREHEHRLETPTTYRRSVMSNPNRKGLQDLNRRRFIGLSLMAGGFSFRFLTERIRPNIVRRESH